MFLFVGHKFEFLDGNRIWVTLPNKDIYEIQLNYPSNNPFTIHLMMKGN